MAKTETEARNEATVRAAFHKWQSGTGNVFELLAEDATWTIAGNSVAARTYAIEFDDFWKRVAPAG